MRMLTLILLCSLPIGCDEHSRADQRKIKHRHIPKMCLDGVQYYDGWRSMAPVFGTDGNVVLCEETF